MKKSARTKKVLSFSEEEIEKKDKPKILKFKSSMNVSKSINKTFSINDSSNNMFNEL